MLFFIIFNIYLSKTTRNTKKTSKELFCWKLNFLSNRYQNVFVVITEKSRCSIEKNESLFKWSMV